ncbi:hypothetical protein GYMLUDRAFT_589321 [Collybiopsis luxurians FD-317 M1]|uniref:Uncharacterized protein n=1 Tax=Collybiopsis luxurians FD-317 M1 TaxID=944289 RepID=A0A0D0CXW1_9AGAR|nr:hypothetical protein GYMLUDRAFT_589321 [Collybiopsis luxurians FD-317 M1]
MQPSSGSVSTLSLQETGSSESADSLSTGTVNTFDGLGSLTGKAILSFGKLTLRGVEQLIISRRLTTIATNFPHHNTDNILGLHSMYADLLELSRIHIYPKSTRIRALQILMRQIACRSTTQLVKALSTAPMVEVKLLLSEILSWFDPIRLVKHRLR